jgi:tetratricopeptide (TPR) repeat protein
VDWQIPLLVSAIAFAAFLVFKMRPAVTPGARAAQGALAEAKRRVEASRDDATRAQALADAADACARLGRTNGAVGFYLRALRSDPSSKDIVQRANAALVRRPRALEDLLWRHLAASPWEEGSREAAMTSLAALADLYGRRPRHRPRARALEHALLALGVKPARSVRDAPEGT